MRNELTARKTVNGVLDFGGIGWSQIDWSWDGGLYHGFSGMDGSRLVRLLLVRLWTGQRVSGLERGRAGGAV